MLPTVAKKALRPLQSMGRKFLMLPSLETQEYVGRRACLNTAIALLTRNQVAGDYAEFGVWEGGSFITAYRALTESRRDYTRLMDESTTHLRRYSKSTPEYERWKQWHPRFFAFDSFAGLPDSPGEVHEDWAGGAFACSEAKFKHKLVRAGVNMNDVVIVPGFYDRSLNQEAKEKHSLRKIALAMIDCDLYESTVPVLNFLTDLIGQGTILIFDDWFRYQASPKCGEQRACREWLERNPQLELVRYWQEAPQTMSFIVNIK
jgi:O-methyltransferase